MMNVCAFLNVSRLSANACVWDAEEPLRRHLRDFYRVEMRVPGFRKDAIDGGADSTLAIEPKRSGDEAID